MQNTMGAGDWLFGENIKREREIEKNLNALKSQRAARGIFVRWGKMDLRGGGEGAELVIWNSQYIVYGVYTEAIY